MMETQRFLINGIHLGVMQNESLPAPRQTLVLLHGFTGSSANWSELLPLLEAPGRRLIALDLLGHGQADAPNDTSRYSIEHCQLDILALLSLLGVQAGEAVLLGYSMGGRVALYTAFSGYLRGLILESASPGIVHTLEREQRRQSDHALADQIERQGIEYFVTQWEKLPLFASQQSLPPETQAALHRQRLTNRAVGLANSLRGLGTGVQPTLHDRLPELQVPTLVLAGELDTKYCQIAGQMASSLPRARLHIVHGAGHTLHLEQPALFAEVVNLFCDAVC